MICKVVALTSMENKLIKNMLTHLTLEEVLLICRKMPTAFLASIKEIQMLNKESTVYQSSPAKLTLVQVVLNNHHKPWASTKSQTSTIWGLIIATIDSARLVRIKSKFQIDKFKTIWVQICHLSSTKEALASEPWTTEETWILQSARATAVELLQMDR